MNLYWCETDDHDEDWFIVASSAKEARRMHEDIEGYGRGDARATLIVRIPKELHPPVGHPTHELLRSLGTVFLSEEAPRIVQVDATVYQEGGMDAVIDRISDDQCEALGLGRPNRTTHLM